MSTFHPLVPGSSLDGDWYDGRIPENVIAGEGTVVDSSFCFKHFFSTADVGLRVGAGVTFWRTSLAAEEGGELVIGDGCYLANASLVCTERITIGDRCLVAGGVTICDSDFHPVDPAIRLADTIAISPQGDRMHRPPIDIKPVTIGNDVWIGWNATILKGVTIGDGAVIAAGALVLRDIEPGVTVAGNPARPVDPETLAALGT